MSNVATILQPSTHKQCKQAPNSTCIQTNEVPLFLSFSRWTLWHISEEKRRGEFVNERAKNERFPPSFPSIIMAQNGFIQVSSLSLCFRQSPTVKRIHPAVIATGPRPSPSTPSRRWTPARRELIAAALARWPHARSHYLRQILITREVSPIKPPVELKTLLI